MTARLLCVLLGHRLHLVGGYIWPRGVCERCGQVLTVRDGRD